MRRHLLVALLALTALSAPLLASCGGGDGERLTVYSGRNQNLIGPLLERFAEETGIDVAVRYGDSAELAAQLLEEGDRSPADVFIAQDAGALGAVEASGVLAPLPAATLERVPARFRSPDGRWVGLSGRARTIVYRTTEIDPADLPDSILDYTDPAWRGRIGWAPTNGSFQAFVTALRLRLGDDAARAWLLGIRANDPVEFPSNTPIVAAVARGEVSVGFVNHYYVHRFIAEQGEGFPARNHFTAPGDVGTMVNVAGAGVLASSERQEAATRLVDFLLSEAAQRYFAEETFEFPVVAGVPASAGLPALADLEAVDIDLNGLNDLQGTLALLRETGILP